MANFTLNSKGVIYFYHWVSPKEPLKVSTKIKIDPAKWNGKKEKAKNDKLVVNGKNVNRELIRFKESFYEALTYCENNNCMTLENLRRKFRELLGIKISQKRKVNNKSFLIFFKRVVDEYKAKNINYWQGYQTTYNHLKNFFGEDDPSFDEINSKFYLEFNDYLFDKGQAKNTINKHWKNIKAVMKQAFLRKLHSNDEYIQFKRYQEKSDTIFLTLDEIRKIEKLKLTGTEEIVRDYFVIGCYTGLRVSDWDKISYDVIDENSIANIKADKTNEYSIIPIHETVKKILKKYNGILPRRPSQNTINKYLKSIGLKAGITSVVKTRITKGGKQVITTQKKFMLIASHTARRSFATNLILEGYPPHVVMKITGHKTITSFEKYVRFDELEASKKLKNMKFFNS